MTALAPNRADAFSLSPEQMAQIAEMVRADSGIALTEAKAPLVVSRLGRRMSALNIPDFGAYFDFVSQPDGREERRRMLSALTTNVTRFFRERHHFDWFAARRAPELIAKARRGGRVRLWSAGCSSGEEPYSLALTLLAAAPDLADRDVRILATDIDPTVLARARTGRYPAASLAAAPAEAVAREFEMRGEMALAGPRLRDMIAFRTLNLIGDWPMQGAFDAIFCRNVLIYFDADGQSDVIRRFADATTTGACLFLGHAERVGPSESQFFQRAEQTTYVRL